MRSPAETSTSASIAAGTTLGAVRLTVSEIDRARDFYERVVGLRALELREGAVSLGVERGRPLVELTGDRSAPPLDPRATGLYHLAILLPSRRDLASALVRLAGARWPLAGASDHLVSEALYLADPDGNGIEIYRDRPREQWPRDDDRLRMATEPLDLDALVGEIRGAEEPQVPAPAGTRIGHVHLQVSDLAGTEAFYSGVLGFEVVVRAYPGALFLSAGGYHHHIGTNVWHSRGAAPPAPGAIGLRSFEIELPDARELASALERVESASIETATRGSSVLIRDPSGIGVELRAA